MGIQVDFNAARELSSSASGAVVVLVVVVVSDDDSVHSSRGFGDPACQDLVPCPPLGLASREPSHVVALVGVGGLPPAPRGGGVGAVDSVVGVEGAPARLGPPVAWEDLFNISVGIDSNDCIVSPVGARGASDGPGNPKDPPGIQTGPRVEVPAFDGDGGHGRFAQKRGVSASKSVERPPASSRACWVMARSLVMGLHTHLPAGV